ncbi:MAG TPA: HEAT repeat domain-containing protein, partial [Lacipirellulaceae bacterium]|nr:HEAT repeat domain-containing protein [Lacipirellulaceae bacterium]
NLAVRVLATNLLIDKFPEPAAQMASHLLSGELHPETKSRVSHAAFGQPSHAVWILQRTAGISEPIARKIMRDGQPGDVQVQMVKALGETASWNPWHFELVQNALRNDDPFVRRAAAEALSKHPAVDNLVPLLNSLNSTPHADAQLYHGTRIALRDQLRDPRVVGSLLTLKLKPGQRKQLVEFAATAPSGPAALLVFDEALRGGISNKLLIKALPAGARYIDAARVDPMVANIAQRFPNNPSQQIELLRALADGISERGLPETARLRDSLTEQIRLAISDTRRTEWFNEPLAGREATPSPWGPQQRNYSDGDINTPAMSSLAEGGERLGGVLHSPAFDLPPQLSFWMCGHDGLPNQPARKLNYIRLVLDDGIEVARTYPPRTDTAQRFTWYLQPYAGKRGHVEVVDGITDLDGFAWLAVARFDPAVITVPDHPVGEQGSERADLFRLAGQLKLKGLMNEIVTAAGAKDTNLIMRLAATDSLLMLDPARAIAPLTTILSDATLPTSAREQAAQQLARIDKPEARTALLSQLKSAPESVAVLIAAGVGSHRDSAPKLLDEIRAGRASATLLREPNVIDGLKSSGLADVDKQIADLTSKLSPKDNRIEKLIAERRAGFLAGKFDPEVGKAVFAKSVCANCHRIGDVGKTLGPTLDGIGNRGLDRLLEDTLDPSRNVDVAFRTVTIETESGQLLTGFGLREEGHALFFNDANGKQLSIPLSEVVERTQSTLSPMPANVIEQIPEQDYYSLLAYLLSLNGK